jgi:hypothetical protein
MKPSFCGDEVMFNSLSCSACQRLDPAQAVFGARGGLVFAADPAGVADAVEVLEQEGVVDLARAGFVAPRVVGQLDVADARQLPLIVLASSPSMRCAW